MDEYWLGGHVVVEFNPKWSARWAISLGLGIGNPLITIRSSSLIILSSLFKPYPPPDVIPTPLYATFTCLWLLTHTDIV